MRKAVVLGLISSASTILSPAAYSVEEGTCEDPIRIDTESHYELTLDTRVFKNQQNDACVDSLATGPDVVVLMAGPIDGTVTWIADFDAVVYYRGDREDWGCYGGCKGASTTGSLTYDSNYHWEGDELFFEPPFIIIDGLNGAAGNISLVFDFGWNVPVVATSWGEIKSNYRK